MPQSFSEPKGCQIASPGWNSDADISEAQIADWSAGSTRSWALEAFALGKRDVYQLNKLPTCAAPGSVALSDSYIKAAQADANLQLRRAGIRMALLLNQALGSS